MPLIALDALTGRRITKTQSWNTSDPLPVRYFVSLVRSLHILTAPLAVLELEKRMLLSEKEMREDFTQINRAAANMH